jgi:glycosyltransferase involved in cell wall biosynthesis
VPNIVLPPDRRPATDATMIGCAGRLVGLKRFDAVIDALPRVRLAVPGARLTIVGDGPRREDLQQQARTMGETVSFPGAVEDAARLIAGFGCLVVASEYEGLPNAALEALAAGVPVATVRAGDLSGLIEEGVTGAIADHAGGDALAAAIVRCLGNPALRAAAVVEGPRLVAERFAPEHTRDTLLAVYRRVTQ